MSRSERSWTSFEVHKAVARTEPCLRSPGAWFQPNQRNPVVSHSQWLTQSNWRHVLVVSSSQLTLTTKWDQRSHPMVAVVKLSHLRLYMQEPVVNKENYVKLRKVITLYYRSRVLHTREVVKNRGKGEISDTNRPTNVRNALLLTTRSVVPSIGQTFRDSRQTVDTWLDYSWWGWAVGNESLEGAEW